MDNSTFLQPVLALIVWTLVMWLWLYLWRIPAMKKARIDLRGRHPDTKLDVLPGPVRAVAANYNHLHEQPTLFYALMGYIALTGGGDPIALALGWVYVALRIAHSLAQVVLGVILVRFAVFCAASLALAALALKEVARVFL